jgi:hypothetical protein
MTDFEGGGTYYREYQQVFQPSQGSMVINPAGLRHEGKAITKGTRYLLVGFNQLVNQTSNFTRDFMMAWGRRAHCYQRIDYYPINNNNNNVKNNNNSLSQQSMLTTHFTTTPPTSSNNNNDNNNQQQQQQQQHPSNRCCYSTWKVYWQEFVDYIDDMLFGPDATWMDYGAVFYTGFVTILLGIGAIMILYDKVFGSQKTASAANNTKRETSMKQNQAVSAQQGRYAKE